MDRSKDTVLFCYKHMVKGGGAEKNLIEVAKGVASQYNILFLIAGGDDQALKDIGKVFVLPGRGRLPFFLVDLLYFIFVILSRRVAIAHSHHRYTSLLAKCSRIAGRHKAITTVHNCFPDKGRFNVWGDLAIAVSDKVRSWLVEECGMPTEKVITIYNGIAPPPDGLSLGYLDEEFHLAGEPVLLAVGRLEKQKNYPLMFKALALMAEKEWTLLVVGDGEDKEDLEAVVREYGLLDRVRFLGFRSDVNALMQRADIFLMSSSWEGLPYVLIEAASNGLPVVATDVGGVKEAVHHGVNGLVVPGDDEDALKTAINQLLDDEEVRRKMTVAGVDLYNRNFELNTMISKVLDVYRDVQA